MSAEKFPDEILFLSLLTRLRALRDEALREGIPTRVARINKQIARTIWHSRQIELCFGDQGWIRR